MGNPVKSQVNVSIWLQEEWSKDNFTNITVQIENEITLDSPPETFTGVFENPNNLSNRYSIQGVASDIAFLENEYYSYQEQSMPFIASNVSIQPVLETESWLNCVYGLR